MISAFIHLRPSRPGAHRVPRHRHPL